MDSVFLSTIGFCFVLNWLCFKLLERNKKVLEYLLWMVDRIHESNLKDLEDGSSEYVDERYRLLNSKSQDRMVVLFWIPLERFYKDVDFKFRDEEVIECSRSTQRS